ncbi:hypothetical protein Poly51_10110 [Rubripirellula tenax]|uniref:Uncharacterized protein n=1 Tax=Rubripirellula tenax TaxID=2528015 RepID=A0A5C6FII0_9BACT|nr:hypothetical protein Poly51_10110 [Rubripirellula tenax]
MINHSQPNLICAFAAVCFVLTCLCSIDWKTTNELRVAQNGFSTGGKRTPFQSPYSNTLSPYLDLLRNDNSALSPYHSFVRPRQRLQQTLGQQAASLRQLQRSVGQPGIAAPVQQRLPTGRGGSFNNHLHFYDFNSAQMR